MAAGGAALDAVLAAEVLVAEVLDAPADPARAPAYDRHYLLAVDDPAKHDAQQRLLNLFYHGEPRLPSLDFRRTECGDAVAALHTGSQLYVDGNRALLALAFPELNQYVSPTSAVIASPNPCYLPLPSHRCLRRAPAALRTAPLSQWRLCRRAYHQRFLQGVALQPHAQRRSGVGLANGGPVTFRQLKPPTTS